MPLSVILIIITLVIAYIKSPNLKFKPFVFKDWVLVMLATFASIISIVIDYNKSASAAEQEAKITNVGTLNPEDAVSDKITWFLAGKPISFISDNINLESIRVAAQFGIVQPFKGVDFNAKLENKKIKVTASIKDTSDNLIVRLIDNEWEVNRPQFAFDRNYNDTALEVIDHHGDVVFQIELSKDKMLLNGKFVLPDGSISMAFPAYSNPKTDPAFWISGLVHFEPGNYKLFNQTKLKPLFKYPSKLNQGKRIFYMSDKAETHFENIPYYPSHIKDSNANYMILY